MRRRTRSPAVAVGLTIIDFATAVLPAEADRGRFTLRTHGGRDQIARSVAEAGWTEFERPLPELFFRAVRRSTGLVVDVGANTGLYTLLAVAASSRNRVVAFEPVPEVFEFLRRNVEDNDVAERVRLIRCAAGDRNGRADLYLPAGGHGLVETSASLRPDFASSHADRLEVPTRTLDRVLFRPSLVGRRVSVIKIDAEGHDAAVIAGASRTIRWCRPVIFVEVLPRADLARLTDFVRRRRYADVRLSPARPPMVGDCVDYAPASWNHALVPREKLFDFLR